MSTSKRILVVEDEILISMEIETLLAENGYAVVNAATSCEAEALVDAGGIDLAILDYYLAGETSGTVAETLADRSVPFLVCSASAGVAELAAKFPDMTIVNKPFSAESLLGAIAATLPNRAKSGMDTGR